MTEAYAPEMTEAAEKYPALGAEYFAARELADRFLAGWQEEHAERLAQEILKPVMDIIQERVWDAFRDHLLTDSRCNVQGEMLRMVESSVRALIGGERWANVKYISSIPIVKGRRCVRRWQSCTATLSRTVALPT